MRKKLYIPVAVFLCLGWGFTMGCSESESRREQPKVTEETAAAKDPPQAVAHLEKARQLAGDDKYLLITERLQCREIGPDGKPTEPTRSGVNAEPTRVFDNVYYVGTTEVGGWLVTTSAGYILIDTMWGESPEQTIVPGMKKLGLDPAKIKYVLLTHYHVDHVDGAKYFQDKYGSCVLLSADDWDMLENPPSRPKAPAASPTPIESHLKTDPPKRDMVGTDGRKLTSGDTTITMVLTPGHTPGSLSFIIPVKDNGEPHMWALWGGTGPPRTLEDMKLYEASAQHFLEYTDAAKVDVAMSNHPFVDGAIERMAELRNRKPGEPNPFVIGQDAVRRYIGILGECSAVWAARKEADVDVR